VDSFNERKKSDAKSLYEILYVCFSLLDKNNNEEITDAIESPKIISSCICNDLHIFY
jgi:hypothetical protein